MTFETLEGVAAWKAANVSHDQWSDWADWFERPLAPRFTVEPQLAELRKLHDPAGHGYFVIDERDATVDFAFDAGEDTVRDFSGTIAATLRAAAEHGARGTFYFLGTAGAEYDFTYKLELANGLSTMETLNEHDIANVYAGDQYQAFLARVMEALGITADGELAPVPDADDADAERAALKQKASAFRKASKAAEPTPPAAAEPEAASVEAAPVEIDADDAIEATPAAKQPAAKQPAAKQPAAKKSAAKKPAAKKPAAKKPAAKKPAAKKPAAKKPAAKKPAAKKPAAKKPAAKKPAAKKKK
jgi:flagellar biosynthesis GTPase FlhF